MYTYEYNNDTGSNDEGFRSWYNIKNPEGEVIAEAKIETDAILIITALNGYYEN